MDDSATPPAAPLKFAVGQPVSRSEDPRLLTGRGRFIDDITLPGEARAVVLRSPVAHGSIRRLDTAAAEAVPGVLAVYTAADLRAAGYGPFPFSAPIRNHDGSPPAIPERHALAGDKVKHIGEPLAFVVAETLDAAQQAVEAIDFEIESLPAVTDPEHALAGDAPRIHDDVGNLCLDWRYGDFEAVDAAFADAAHATRLRLPISRVAVAPIETRGAIAEYDAERERFTLRVCSQGVHGMRQTLAKAILKIDPEKLRVLSPDVGGSFGMKAQQHPENVLVLHAARDLGRPVKWVDDRSGAFLSDCQGRDMLAEAELALNAEGRFLAVRVTMLGNLGAYATGFGPVMPAVNIQKNTPSLYATPLLAVHSRCVFTNSVPIGPYRGAGRPEGNYIMERLVDAAARETGIDPVELRRRNLIPPKAIPFRAASGLEYDSGDFPAVLDAALASADWDGYDGRRAASEARGLLRGRALTSYLEVTAPAGKELGGVRFGADGRVEIVTGTHDQGQGHATAFAQVLADRLGLGRDDIALMQDDSDEVRFGGGTGGSKSIMASGNAIVQAADEAIAKGRLWAGHVLEAAVADIEFAAGEFRVAGTDRAIELRELAARIATTSPVPDGLPASLDSELVTETPPSTFPNGCHICELEIDPATGATRIDRYSVVDDFGVLVNPLLVEGQVHGGVVQGIGQVLMEGTVYDQDGQLLTGSFLDYAMPRAADVPSFRFRHHGVPAITNPLGVKGCGEAGTSAAIPTVMNAVLDALAPLGVTGIEMPATPERIWRAIRAANPQRRS